MHLGCVTYNVLKDWDLDTIVAKLARAAVTKRWSCAPGTSMGWSHPSARPSASGPEEVRAQQSPAAELRQHLRVPVARPGRAPEEHRRRRSSFIDLAHDTGALGRQSSPERTAERGTAARRPSDEHRRRLCGSWAITAAVKGIEIWMEVHGQRHPESAGRGRDHEGVQSPKRRRVLELQSDGCGERHR